MSKYLMICTGDVGIQRKEPASMFRDVKDELAKADLVFGQCEFPLSDRGSIDTSAVLPCKGMPESAQLMHDVGYRVMSFASNHTMDWGRDAFYDTLENLKNADIKMVGAGINDVECRKPAIYTMPDGTKIGFLGYSSIVPNGTWATDERPGLNKLRGVTVAYPREADQPQTPRELYSFPHPDDLEMMLADIKVLRPQVDILCVSMHWGIHFVPGAIAQYQRYMAQFAINEGADIILGHHAHIMKPMEYYHGKPIIYCMANFAIEGPRTFSPNLDKTQKFQKIAKLNKDFADPNKEMPEDSYKSYFLKVHINDGKIEGVSFSPVWLNKEDCHPEMLHAGDERFDKVVDYMRFISNLQHIDTRYEVDDDDVWVLPPEE